MLPARHPPSDAAAGRRPTARPAGIPWETIFDVLAEGVVIYDAAGRLTWANEAAIAACGLNPVGATSVTLATSLAARDPDGRLLSEDRLPSQRALRGELVQAEQIIFTDTAGADIHVLATAAPLRVGEEITGAIVVWRAVAAPAGRQPQDDAQAISRRLVEVQEAERRRIARELHDEVGQALTAVKINLQAIQQSGDARAAAGRLQDSIAVVERALQQVRNISLDLRPSLLDDLGLVSALRWYVDNQAQRAGLTAAFNVAPPDLRLPADLETDCFRVAQEALTNAIRHAHATRVEVSLQSTGHGVRLLIRDNGVGFNVAHALAQAAHGKSLGLVGLRERAALAGGRLEIISTRGRGTEVRAWFPTAPTQPLQ